jgi:hypothetical protein
MKYSAQQPLSIYACTRHPMCAHFTQRCQTGAPPSCRADIDGLQSNVQRSQGMRPKSTAHSVNGLPNLVRNVTYQLMRNIVRLC